MFLVRVTPYKFAEVTKKKKTFLLIEFTTVITLRLRDGSEYFHVHICLHILITPNLFGVGNMSIDQTLTDMDVIKYQSDCYFYFKN